MTYSFSVVIGVALALAVDLVVLRTRLILSAVFWATYPVVVAAQLISNGLLTGLGVVRYRPSAILGLRVGYAPVEDLAFGFALVLVSLSVWVWLGRFARLR
jgi:lycopene cyclase domain-containing protein